MKNKNKTKTTEAWQNNYDMEHGHKFAVWKFCLLSS